MVELASEVCEVADAEGVALEHFDDFDPTMYLPRRPASDREVARALAVLVEQRRNDPKKKTGIWRDLAVHHRPTEVDEQLGIVASRGDLHGLGMPLTRHVITMIHEIERDQREMCWDNLVALAGQLNSEASTT